MLYGPVTYFSVTLISSLLSWAALGLCRCTGFPLVAVRGDCSPQCTDFSLQWLLLLQLMGSRVHGLQQMGPWALEHRLNSMACLLLGMWHLPRPGTEPVSLALAGKFFTTEPPGKPCFPIVLPSK